MSATSMGYLSQQQENTNQFAKFSHMTQTRRIHSLVDWPLVRTMPMASAALAPNLPSAAEICSKTQEVFGKTPCLFQIELCLAQLQAQYNNQDIISIAPTGSGKTLCFLMPLLFNNKITIIVTALNLLGEQFSQQAKDVGISAVAVTAANNTHETFQVRYH